MAHQIGRTAFSLTTNKSLRVLQRVVNSTCTHSTTTSTASADLVDKATTNGTLCYSPEQPLIQFPQFQTRSLMPPREAIVESLAHSDPVGLVSLNPEVFSQLPLLHVIKDNLKWQLDYQKINYIQPHNRAECPGGGRKPWPQKGLGKARHGSVRSPIFLRGGIAHGPRRYTTKFYMLSYPSRILGLTSTLSVKHAQDDLKIVENLSLPTADPEYLQQLIDDRVWGPSVVFVDVDDVMPENITLATDSIGHLNLMPVYGLNVFSMLKYVTLVMTVAAARRIEDRIMHCLYGTHRMVVDDEFRGKTFGL